MPAIRRCCIVDCNSNSRDDPELHFFHLRKPTNKHFNKWRHALRSSMWRIQMVKNPLICSLHFTADHMNGRRLKATAVPTVRMGHTPAPSESSSMTGEFETESTASEFDWEPPRPRTRPIQKKHININNKAKTTTVAKGRNEFYFDIPQTEVNLLSGGEQHNEDEYSEPEQVRDHKRKIMDAAVYEWFVRANLTPQIAGNMTKSMIIEVAQNAKDLIGVTHVKIDDNWMAKFREDYLNNFIQKLNSDELGPTNNSLYLPEIIQDVLSQYIRAHTLSDDNESIVNEEEDRPAIIGAVAEERSHRTIKNFSEVVNQLNPLKTYAFFKKSDPFALDLIYDVENALR